jgi:nucleoside-diphosphate-sugar epimerase
MISAALVPQLDGTVDLGSGTLVPIGDVVQELAHRLGKAHLLQLGEGPRRDEVVRAADASRARRCLGFETKVSLSEGLSKTIDWYRGRLARVA